MPRASCTLESTRECARRWCSGMAQQCGSTRRRYRWRPRRWTDLRPAVPAPAASVLRRRPYSSVQDDRSRSRSSALLRWLHLLLDHRARGRIIQNRSEHSCLREIEKIRDQVPGFTGVISDLGARPQTLYRWRARAARSNLPAAGRRACSGISPNSQHDPYAAHRTVPARRARCRDQEGAGRIRRALTTCGRVAQYVRELTSTMSAAT